MKAGGSAPPYPHQPGLILPSWWNVRHKAAVATLCSSTRRARRWAQSTHWVAVATFWRRYIPSVMEKLAQSGEGWGMHSHPFSPYLPSSTKLWCMLQLRGQIHSPYFLLYPYMYSVEGRGAKRCQRLWDTNAGPPQQSVSALPWKGLRNVPSSFYTTCIPRTPCSRDWIATESLILFDGIKRRSIDTTGIWQKLVFTLTKNLKLLWFCAYSTLWIWI